MWIVSATREYADVTGAMHTERHIAVTNQPGSTYTENVMMSGKGDPEFYTDVTWRYGTEVLGIAIPPFTGAFLSEEVGPGTPAVG